MLKITSHKGFHITFKNGWTASVQFGPGNYCSNHDIWEFDAPKNAEVWESYDAEVAAWEKGSKDMIKIVNDTVEGYVKPDEILIFLNWVAGEDHSNPPQNLRNSD